MSADLTKALTALHEAGRIASPWMAGMLARCGEWSERVVERKRTGGVRLSGGGDVGHGCTPDLSDPLTVQALLLVVREASGQPRACMVPLQRGRWGVAIPNPIRRGPQHKGPTEAEALCAALHALAEECRRG